MDLAQAEGEIDKLVAEKLNWVSSVKTGDPDKDRFLDQGFITYGGMSKSFLQMKELGTLTGMEYLALEMSMSLWKELLSKVSSEVCSG